MAKRTKAKQQDAFTSTLEESKPLEEQLQLHFGKVNIANTEIPVYLLQNLAHSLREYQVEGLQLFLTYYEKEFPKKTYPQHVLFNMATGSGKTLMMAALILYLYKQGHRNFIFFVNSNNILSKTKDNFLNKNSSKYLFRSLTAIDGINININEVNSFDDCHADDINIIFTTIHGLHSTIANPKENAITLEDFQSNKVVLLADEAHHFNAKTKKQSLQEELSLEEASWENTVAKILRTNPANILLDFTATMDFENQDIAKKYQNKLIYTYNLQNFNKDKYSKDIALIQADLEDDLFINEAGNIVDNHKKLMLLACLTSYYRQEIALKYNIKSFKPVIMFKAAKTIQESFNNQENFNTLIENLSKQDIEAIFSLAKHQKFINSKEKAEHLIVRTIEFLQEKYSKNLPSLIARLQNIFQPSNCINVNDSKGSESESSKDKKLRETNNKLLNSLEEPSNNIRVIFAVNKLNEGWDVLNLFDIVRLYNTRDSDFKSKKIGKTTMAEAQLIGRGARYYPFQYDNYEVGRRKFDLNPKHELTALEKMYYYSIKNVRYISELREALKKIGIEESLDKLTTEIKLKEDFVNSKVYKEGVLYVNDERHIPFYEKQTSLFVEEEVQKNNVKYTETMYTIPANTASKEQKLMVDSNEEIHSMLDVVLSDTEKTDDANTFRIHAIPEYVLKNALLYCKNEMNSAEYISKIQEHLIQFKGNTDKLNTIEANKYLFAALLQHLKKIENTVEKMPNTRGSKTFYPKPIKKLLKYTKTVYVEEKKKDNFNRLQKVVQCDKFFVYDSLHIDSGLEETFYKGFCDFYKEHLQNEYKEVYLIRNHLEVPFYTFKEGRKFYPDFLLFLETNSGEIKNYQIIMEAKGNHLRLYEKEKEDFLIKIQAKSKIKHSLNNSKIIGLPFFTGENPIQFFDELRKQLD